MSYIAPGQSQQEARWFTPGGGIATGMAKIPEVARRIAQWEGGSNLGGRGTQMAQDWSETLSSLVKMYERDPDLLVRLGKRLEQDWHRGARNVATVGHRPVDLAGGMHPSPEAWSGAINQAGGMNHPQVRRMLGFGQ